MTMHKKEKKVGVEGGSWVGGSGWICMNNLSY